MKIEALCSINSGKHQVGDILNVGDVQAKALIASGAAREVTDKKKPVTPEREPETPITPRADRDKIAKDRKPQGKGKGGK